KALFEALGELKVPVVVHYRRPYPHFALVISRVENSVLVSDPIRGVHSLEMGDFLYRLDEDLRFLVVQPGRHTNQANAQLFNQRIESAKERIRALKSAASIPLRPVFKPCQKHCSKER